MDATGYIHFLVASEMNSSNQTAVNKGLASEDPATTDLPLTDPHPMLNDPGFGVRTPAGSQPPASASSDATSPLAEPTSRTHLPPGTFPTLKRAGSGPNRNRLNLYIMRHASAGTRRANAKLDVKRSLDKEGKQHCFHLAHVLNGLKLNFDLVVSSPLKRSLQTAQLIGTETGYEAKILHSDALKPEADFSQFQRLVHECRTFENVLMVGHNPTLTSFLGQLIGQVSIDGDQSAMARVRLRKGSIARVTLERGPGLLQWMLEPRIVRALYTTSTKSSRRKTSRK
ncbi:MAG: SixA phosphatase family protein [Janthinobacterium lividum]